MSAVPFLNLDGAGVRVHVILHLPPTTVNNQDYSQIKITVVVHNFQAFSLLLGKT